MSDMNQLSAIALGAATNQLCFLETGATDKYAFHILADQVQIFWTFKYEVKDGDASPDLSYFWMLTL